MSIYPSLEDMKTTELIKAQMNAMQPIHEVSYPSSGPQYPPIVSNTATAPSAVQIASAYPSLTDFLGLELTEEMIRLNMPEYLPQIEGNGHHAGNYQVATTAPNSVAIPQNNAGVKVMAPVSGSKAVIKSMVTHGVRMVKIQKGAEKVGLRVRSMHTGVFVCLVQENSAAAAAGLRFGDQILQIDNEDMAGKSVNKVHAIFKKAPKGSTLELAVRDRPFERTVTLVRDSHRHIGFQFKNGKIVNIVKDSSASRNGLLTEHALLEVNGKNVIGLKDKEITKIIDSVPGTSLTVTVMPAFLFDHMVKEMANSLFGKMDHGDPDF